MLIQTKGVKIENNRDSTVVAYVDEIVLISETEDEPRNVTWILSK